VPPLIAAIGPILAAIGGGSAVAGGITAGTLGLTAAELIKAATEGGGGSGKLSPAQQAAQVASQNNSLKATVANQAPNYQSQTEGGLSPNYIAQQIGANTGELNNLSSLQDLVKQYTGGGGGPGSTANLPQGDIGPGPSGGGEKDNKGLIDLQSYLGIAA
jgi:hypothetical protein